MTDLAPVVEATVRAHVAAHAADQTEEAMLLAMLGLDDDTDTDTGQAARKPRQLKPCGTIAAHQRHRKRGEKPCEACRDARNTHDRKKWAEQHVPRQLKPCGTPAAYWRHRRRGEKPCEACRDAKLAYQRDRYRIRRGGRGKAA